MNSRQRYKKNVCTKPAGYTGTVSRKHLSPFICDCSLFEKVVGLKLSPNDVKKFSMHKYLT